MRQLVLSEQLAKDILQHITEFADHHEVVQQRAVLADVAGSRAASASPSVAEAVDTDHQPPLNLGGPFQKALDVTRDRAADRRIRNT